MVRRLTTMPSRKTIAAMLVWVASTMAARAFMVTFLGDGTSQLGDLILMTAFLTPIWAFALGSIVGVPTFLLARVLALKPRPVSGAAGVGAVVGAALCILLIIGSALAMRGYSGEPTTPLDLVSLLSGFWPLGRFSILLVIEAIGIAIIARRVAINSLKNA